ncbi:MAG: PLP-dependent aminotransferase family protein [Clostridia bacterium]|nr:PLP-dependent aminotransferase family protein [Clostridia bacterium]
MRYTVDGAAREPVYLQLYRQLREDIVSGVYPFGSKLPSKRLLAGELGISLVTVEHALLILCDEGYIGTRERSGCYVTYRAGDGFVASPLSSGRARRHMPHGEGAADALPFSVLARTMRRVISEYADEILTKSPGSGSMQLRRAIAAYLARSRGMNVLPQQIVIGSGAEYLYGLVVQMLGRDRVFGLEDPCYEKIPAVFRAHGATFEMLAMGEEGITTDALQQSRADVLHVTPYHSYPSGVTATASKRREYIAFAAARRGYLIEDDFDSEFTVSAKMEDTLYALDTEGRVIYMNTFTKTVAPSVRVGYMVLPASLLPLFEERVGFYSFTVPSFEQTVLAELLDSGDFERHINRRRRQKRREQSK